MPELEFLCERVTVLEITLEGHDKRLTSLGESTAVHTKALEENTKVTKEIASNTAELVELFKGAKLFRKFVLWTVGIVAPLWAVVEAVQHILY